MPKKLTMKNRIVPEQGGSGPAIRDRRKRQGRTLEGLSACVGVTNAYLSMIERGKGVASEDLLRRIANE